MSQAPSPARIGLKPGRERRLLRGHPWVYAGEIEKTDGPISPGEIVDLYDARGSFLGRGYFNPSSQIRVRVLSFEPEAIDGDFLRRRLQQAIDRRSLFSIPSDACRLVFSEADLLPGLILDRYGPYLVIQLLALGMEVRREMVLSLVRETLNPLGIYARNDLHVRELGAFPQAKACSGEKSRTGFRSGRGDSPSGWMSRGGRRPDSSSISGGAAWPYRGSVRIGGAWTASVTPGPSPFRPPTSGLPRSWGSTSRRRPSPWLRRTPD